MATFTTAENLGNFLLSPENRAKTVWVHNPNQLALGPSPGSPTHLYDFASEARISLVDDERDHIVFPAPDDGRRTGDFWFEIRGQRTSCRSLKQLLIEGLRAIESAHPGTMEKLSRLKPRNRRVVARVREDLFDNPQLRRDINKRSECLDDVWWVSTNNSREQVRSALARAGDLAGLRPGEDFKTSLGGWSSLADL